MSPLPVESPGVCRMTARRHLALVAAGLLVAVHFALLALHCPPAFSSPDANGYYAQAALLAEKGTVALEPSSALSYIGMHWLETPDGEFFSRYPPGVAVLMYVPYVFAGPELAALVTPLLASLTLLFLFLLARPYLGGGFALLAAGLYGLHPLANEHALNWGAHTQAGFFPRGRALCADGLGAAAALGEGARRGAAPRRRADDALRGGGRGAGRRVFLLMRAWPEPRLWRHVGVALLGALVPVGGLLVFNASAFGSPLDTGYALTGEQQAGTGFALSFFEQKWEGFASALMTSGLGLFFALGLAGLGGMLRLRETRALGVLLTLVIVPVTVAYTAYYWGGGGQMGLRFLLPTLPLYLIPALWLFRVGIANVATAESAATAATAGLGSGGALAPAAAGAASHAPHDEFGTASRLGEDPLREAQVPVGGLYATGSRADAAVPEDARDMERGEAADARGAARLGGVGAVGQGLAPGGSGVGTASSEDARDMERGDAADARGAAPAMRLVSTGDRGLAGQVLRAGLLVLVVIQGLYWGANSVLRVGREGHNLHSVHEITAYLQRELPDGGVVIADRGLQDTLQYFQRWELVDASVVTGRGMARERRTGVGAGGSGMPGAVMGAGQTGQAGPTGPRLRRSGIFARLRGGEGRPEGFDPESELDVPEARPPQGARPDNLAPRGEWGPPDGFEGPGGLGGPDDFGPPMGEPGAGDGRGGEGSSSATGGAVPDRGEGKSTREGLGRASGGSSWARGGQAEITLSPDRAEPMQRGKAQKLRAKFDVLDPEERAALVLADLDKLAAGKRVLWIGREAAVRAWSRYLPEGRELVQVGELEAPLRTGPGAGAGVGPGAGIGVGPGARAGFPPGSPGVGIGGMPGGARGGFAGGMQGPPGMRRAGPRGQAGQGTQRLLVYELR
jgi:hypothetical protein